MEQRLQTYEKLHSQTTTVTSSTATIIAGVVLSTFILKMHIVSSEEQGFNPPIKPVQPALPEGLIFYLCILKMGYKWAVVTTKDGTVTNNIIHSQLVKLSQNCGRIIKDVKLWVWYNSKT